MNLLTAQAPVLTNLIGKFLQLLSDSIGNFGWAIVVFTIILKTILLPLDIWPKISQRKTQRKMAAIQKKKKKLQKQYGNNREELGRRQMALYKKEKISMFGMLFSTCLPLIVTMTVFILVFNAVQDVVRYQNELLVYNLNQLYESLVAQGASAETINNSLSDFYYSSMQSWLWVKNVFMPDNWSQVVPSAEVFLGTGWGKMGAVMPEGVNTTYNTLVGPALASSTAWNGYMILPIISTAIAIASQLMIKLQTKNNPSQNAAEKQMGGVMKVMQIALPVMVGVFALFYSAIFSIYFLVNSLISFITQGIFTLVVRTKDKQAEEHRLSTTYVRKK